MWKEYALLMAVVSLITFIVYGTDKKRAIQRKRRVPEKLLLGLSFFMGAVGGLVAMQLFRHKTRHWYFYFVNFVGIIWQVGLLIYLINNPTFLVG